MIFDFEDGFPILMQAEKGILALQATNAIFLLLLQRES